MYPLQYLYHLIPPNSGIDHVTLHFLFPLLEKKKLKFCKSSHISYSMEIIDWSPAPTTMAYSLNMYYNSSAIITEDDGACRGR